MKKVILSYELELVDNPNPTLYGLQDVRVFSGGGHFKDTL